MAPRLAAGFSVASPLRGVRRGQPRPRRSRGVSKPPVLNPNGSPLSKKWRLDVQAQKRVKFVTLSLNANTANAASIMSDQASLLATIAGLQEQIDAMNGQLTEVNAPSCCPFRQRAVRARRAAEAGCPRPRGGPAPSTPPPARPYTPSPARPGRRNRARDHKTKTPPAAAPQAHRHGRHRRLLAHLRRRPRLLDAGPRPASARHRLDGVTLHAAAARPANPENARRRASPCSRSAPSTRRTRRTFW